MSFFTLSPGSGNCFSLDSFDRGKGREIVPDPLPGPSSPLVLPLAVGFVPTLCLHNLLLRQNKEPSFRMLLVSCPGF